MTSPVMQSKSVAASAPSITVAFDNVPIVGSILVLVGNSTQGIATPAGWTQRANFAGDQGFYIWTKTSAGSADTSTTVTPNSSAPITVTKLELNANDVQGFDVVSAINGASNANNVPISSVTSTGINGAFLLAVGAMHGWPSGVPAPVPSYTGAAAWTHLTTALVPGTGSGNVGHWVGEALSSSAGASGTVILSNTTVFDNTAGFLLAFHRTPPLVIVPITAVNSSTGWTLSGAADALTAMTDESDTSRLTSGDLAGSTAVVDVQLGSMEKPPATFVVRVRAIRDAVSGSITGKLYDGATLVSTSAPVALPATFSNLLLTFPAGEIAATDAADWLSGLRLTVTATAS